MANTPISDVIKQVRRRIVDEDAIRWENADMVDYFNSAVKAILVIRPDAHVIHKDFTCAVGAKQKLDDGVNLLINVVRNKDGRTIRGPVDSVSLDSYDPDWRIATPESAADAYLYEERDPLVFYLQPPVTAGTIIEIITAEIPEPVSVADFDAAKAGPLGPLYDNAIIEYMVYLAFSQDNEFAANANKAQLALQAFNAMLGNKNQSDSMNATSYQREQNKPR